MIKNERNGYISIRTVTRWRIYIDYIKLNKTTRKDYYSLPSLDPMLNRLVGHEHYYFLGGYSRYNEIVISLKDRGKTTLTCPYGTFAFRRISLSCNARTTF